MDNIKIFRKKTEITKMSEKISFFWKKKSDASKFKNHEM